MDANNMVINMQEEIKDFDSFLKIRLDDLEKTDNDAWNDLRNEIGNIMTTAGFFPTLMEKITFEHLQKKAKVEDMKATDKFFE